MESSDDDAVAEVFRQFEFTAVEHEEFFLQGLQGFEIRRTLGIEELHLEFFDHQHDSFALIYEDDIRDDYFEAHLFGFYKDFLFTVPFAEFVFGSDQVGGSFADVRVGVEDEVLALE